MKTNTVIGDPIDHSLSPIIHTTAYKSLGIDDEFVFNAVCVPANELEKYMKQVKEQPINGLAVTVPHKQAIVNFLDRVDDTAKEIGAVNTVVKEGGLLVGYNTDWIGAVDALEAVVDLKDKKVALIGTGGAARAIAYGVKQSGARLTIFGRDSSKVIEISKQFGAMPAHIDAQSEIAGHDIIINATSVGLSQKTEPELVAQNLLDADHVVFDITYPRETMLLRSAEKAGARTITGLEMLIYQAIPQCELHTGKRPDLKVLRDALKGQL